MIIIAEVSLLWMVISFRAKFSSANNLRSDSTLIRARVSNKKLRRQRLLIADLISSLLILARNPKRPKLIPITGIFESLIRVKDQEMILLGGLEEKNVRDTRSGLPLLSRIPLLRWIFSSRQKTNSNSKLNIFIKPTIIY